MSWLVARTEDGKYVCRGGLGALGVGQMWFAASDYDRSDPDYASLPVKPVGWPFVELSAAQCNVIRHALNTARPIRPWGGHEDGAA